MYTPDEGVELGAVIPVIDPVIGNEGVEEAVMVITDPVFEHVRPVGRVHDVVPRVN